MATVAQKRGKGLVGTEQTDAPWRCCCRWRTLPRASSQHSRDAALPRAELAFNRKSEPKSLESKYCGHAGPAHATSGSSTCPSTALPGLLCAGLPLGLRCHPVLITTELPGHGAVQPGGLRSISGGICRGMNSELSAGRVLPEEMQREDYLFLE